MYVDGMGWVKGGVGVDVGVDVHIHIRVDDRKHIVVHIDIHIDIDSAHEYLAQAHSLATFLGNVSMTRFG